MLQVGSLWQWLVQLKNQRWCVTLQLVSFSNILLPLLLPLSSSWLYFMLPVCAGVCSHITKTGQKEKKASSKDRTICSLTQDIQGRKRYELYPMLHWFIFSSCLLHSLSTHSSPPQSSSDPNVFPLARSLTATFQGMHGMPGMYEQQMQGGTWQTRLLHFKGLFLVPFLIILIFCSSTFVLTQVCNISIGLVWECHRAFQLDGMGRGCRREWLRRVVWVEQHPREGKILWTTNFIYINFCSAHVCYAYTPADTGGRTCTFLFLHLLCQIKEFLGTLIQMHLDLDTSADGCRLQWWTKALKALTWVKECTGKLRRTTRHP